MGWEQPIDEAADEFLSVLEGGLRLGWTAKDELCAAGGSVHDAGVGAVLLDLFESLLDCGGCIAVDLIFPSDDGGVGEEAVEFADEFFSGSEVEG